MATNVNINKMLEANVPSTSTDGTIIFSEQGNLYIYNQSGSKIKVSDLISVATLPATGLSNKIYILLSDYSLNYYDSAWRKCSGTNQIIIGISQPTDITKLWLDITDFSSPILKYYNGTSWININHFHLNKVQLDKISEDSITGEMKYNNQTVINADISNRSNGKAIVFNSSTGRNEYADINVSGIVGSSQITVAGQNVTIGSGVETVFSHPSSTNIIPVIEEQIAGNSITDTHVDFGDSSKYTLQDSGKMLICNNRIQLDIYPKLLMHMDDNNFTEVYNRTIINHNVTLNTTYQTFGSGCAYFNGSSYFSVPNDICNFGTNDFTIDFIIKMPSASSYPCLIGNSSGSIYNAIYPSDTANGGKLSIVNGSNTRFLVSTKRIDDNVKHHIVVQRKNGVLQFIIDGVLNNSINYTSSMNWNVLSNVFIGWDGTQSNAYFTGYLDELRIIKGIGIFPNNFVPPTQPYNVINVTTNVPLYVQTTGSSDYSLTTIDTITSLTIPVTTTVNSTVKCLFSVDNKSNWLYYNGTSVQKFTGDITQDWGSINSSYTQLQTYFTNKTITSLTNDLSSLGIVPITLNLAFQLNTNTTSETSTVGAITMVYTTLARNEFASIGTYSDSSTYGIKRISNGSLGVKNKSAVTKVIKLSIITSA